MNVLIAQKDYDLALELADQVTRAGGRVTRIVLNADEAMDLMTAARAPDVIFLDPDMSMDAESGGTAGWQAIRSRVCLYGKTTQASKKTGNWPVLKDASILEDIRIVLQAARHFGRQQGSSLQ